MNDYTVAISGYRRSKMALTEPAEGLDGRIEGALRGLLDQGFATFCCGMADGFDLAVGAVLLRLRADYPSLSVIVAIPFEGHRRTIDPQDLPIYDALMQVCRERLVASNSFSKRAYLRRNEMIIERSSLLLCYYAGHAGGTRYTIKLALKGGLRILNLCQERSLDALF